MRVFIAGAEGWAGSEILSQVIERFGEENVVVIGTSGSKVKNSFFDVSYEERYEVFDDVVEDDVLINCIGVIHPRTRYDFRTVNVMGLSRLFRSFAEKGGKRIIHISSNSVLGTNKDNEAFTCNSICDPYLGYGQSKLLAEHSLLSLKMQFDIQPVILRVPWFHGGKNMPQRQRDFYKMVINGKFPLVGNGDNIRSVLNVSNLGRAIVTILDDFKPAIFWLSDRENLKFKDYLNLIRSIANEQGISTSKRFAVRLPSMMARFARCVDAAMQAFGFYNTKIHVIGELDLDIYGDVSEFCRTYPKFELVSLADGVSQAIRNSKNYIGE